jgi:hypothetical protein
MDDLQERIQQRAYQFFCDRGHTEGHEHDDWLRAEHEVLGNDHEQSTFPSEAVLVDASGSFDGKASDKRKVLARAKR